jgi:hypothetical protein
MRAGPYLNPKIVVRKVINSQVGFHKREGGGSELAR